MKIISVLNRQGIAPGEGRGTDETGLNLYSKSFLTFSIIFRVRLNYLHNAAERNEPLLDKSTMETIEYQVFRNRLNSCFLRELTRGKFLISSEQLLQLENIGQGICMEEIMINQSEIQIFRRVWGGVQGSARSQRVIQS